MNVTVSTTTLSASSPSSAVQYFESDVLILQSKGADDVEQVAVQHNSDPVCFALFGKSGGVRMNNPTDRIALPCPEYCKGKGDLLDFDDARALVTGS